MLNSVSGGQLLLVGKLDRLTGPRGAGTLLAIGRESVTRGGFVAICCNYLLRVRGQSRNLSHQQSALSQVDLQVGNRL